MKNLKKQSSKKGYTLIELIISLGIITILGALIFILVPKVVSSYKAQAETTNINTIRASVNSLYASSASYKDLTTETAIAAKVFPESMLLGADAKVANNGFKGNVTVKASDVSPSASADSSFTIVYEKVPANECVKIVSSVAAGFYQVEVGTGTGDEATGTKVKDPAKDGALSITDLTTACNTGKNANTITFVAL